MECKHPEAFISIIKGKRICGLCGKEASDLNDAPEIYHCFL